MKVAKVLIEDSPGLGDRIRQAREADGRSLLSMCRESGMKSQNWYKIENEETKVLPVETLLKIEAVLGIDFGVRFKL